MPRPRHPALAHLKRADPVLYPHAARHASAILAASGHRRGYRRLFAALAGSIVSQQLSTKAADTIWARLEAATGGDVTPESIAALRLDAMRAAGLSAAKTRSLKELSAAVLEGRIDFRKLKKLSEEEAIATLSSVWGIGTWTAEMFLMFALDREDIFSSKDLGLLRSMELLYGIPKDSPKEIYIGIAERWSPYRTFACRVLWRVRDANAAGI